ncbi:hypothetical protein HGRIS_006900 [Hohenbuehelia grisea]|uniref:Uncharacterized protein n=1 Tax=Hohenbuehelia grisea TaxID=104357 RepID=A0ABR3JAR6_9AGAR
MDVNEVVKQVEDGSVGAFWELHSYFCTHASDIPSLLPLLPPLFTHLKAKHIPTEPTNGPAAKKRIQRAKWSLCCLAELVLILPNPGRGTRTEKIIEEVSRSVFVNADDVLPWASFLQQHYLKDYPVDDTVPLPDMLRIVHGMIAMIFSLTCSNGFPVNSPTIKFCFEAWYRLGNVRIPPESSRHLSRTIAYGIYSFWQNFLDKPSEIIWSIVPNHQVLLDTAIHHFTWQLEVATAIPVCADPEDNLLALATSTERVWDILAYKNVEIEVNPGRFANLLLSTIGAFAERRRAILALPRRFRCGHRDPTGQDIHDPSGPRGVMEARIIEDSWAMMGRCITMDSGLQFILKACKRGLFENILRSGFIEFPPDAQVLVRKTGFHIKMLGLYFPCLSVFPAVLRAFEKSLRDIEARQLQPFPRNDPKLVGTWTAFKKHMATLLHARSTGQAKQRLFQQLPGYTCGPRQVEEMLWLSNRALLLEAMPESRLESSSTSMQPFSVQSAQAAWIRPKRVLFHG